MNQGWSPVPLIDLIASRPEYRACTVYRTNCSKGPLDSDDLQSCGPQLLNRAPSNPTVMTIGRSLDRFGQKPFIAPALKLTVGDAASEVTEQAAELSLRHRAGGRIV